MEETIESLEGFIQQDLLFTILAAVIIIVATAVVSIFLSRFMRRVLSKDSNPLPSSSIFINLIRASVWIIGICIMLDMCFSIDVTGIIAALGVGGIALSLGLQDTISNLVGGLQVSLNKIIEPGDHIKVSGQQGTVKDITWRHTTLATLEGNEVIIPNSAINKEAIVRFSENHDQSSS